MDEIRDDFMIRGQMKAAFLVVTLRSPDLDVKRKKNKGRNPKNGLRRAYFKMAN